MTGRRCGAGLAGLVLCATAAVTHAQGGVERRIAGIVVGQDRLEQVTARYGEAPPHQLRDGVSVCYHITQEDAYLVVFARAADSRVEYALLTRAEEAPPALPCPGGIVTGPPLQTGGGIVLGDPPGKVAQAYGEPRQRGTERDGLLAIGYPGPGLTTVFWFRDDRLVRVVIAGD